MRILLLALLLATGCAPTEAPPSPTEPDVEYLSSDAYGAMDLPFSEAVRVGELLFLSGQIGNVPGEFRLVEGGIEAEARQTMNNMADALERHGSSLEHVVKCTVFMADMAEWGAFNEVYREYFDNLPARSALGANGLALNARVEVECIAVVP